MNSSTIVSIIHSKNSNGLRKLFQLQKVVPKPLQKGIDNDIYSTIDACPNACEMWKAIERLKQGKAIVNSSTPTYDQEPAIVANDDELSKEKEIDKLMALISLSFKKIYKPTNENLRTSSNTSRANQDNTPRINRGTGYDNQRAVNVVGASENVEKADWRDDTDDEPEDQEVEAHYLYMAKIQEVTLDAADNFGPIFDIEPLQKVQNDNDNYNVFANDKEHLEQPVNDTYLEEQGDTNITIDSLDMSTNGETIDQDDDDLAKEHDLLASLFEKLKCEIDDSKNRNKSLESSNKTLINKLKGEIEDFKTKNKSLESSNNHFKEANNELSKTNQLMFKDLKKFQAELDRYHDVNYTSKMKIDCVKAKGDLMSYKMESQKSLNKHTRNINDLHQMISEMKKVLVAHQETISIMSQEKEAQNKFYKTREDKEIEKVIALENKVKVLDDIVYKIGQSVQIMNMLNRNCKTSFIKPKYLKKTQRANPRLYDIGCYNDNIALMLAPESDKMIRLAQESRSKLSDLIKLFDYENLNNLYHLFVPQREKSPEQRYFSERTKQPIVVPISTREPKQTVNQSAATPLKRTVAITPSGYKWKPKSKTVNVEPNVSLHLGTKSRTTNILEPTTLRKSTVSNTPSSSNSFAARRDILFIVDSRCSKHITENVKLLSNFVEQFLGTVKFENDQIAPILGYRDLVQENGNDLLIGSRGTDLHSITLQDTSTPNPICLMDKASSSMVMASSSFTSILRYHQLAFNA
ncbi:hypothetical protein Tco_1061614 [Tanacetum coccineum]